MELAQGLKLLGEAIQKDRLVVLAGAGVSMGPPAALPSWSGFVEKMAGEAAKYDESRATMIRRFAADPVKAGTYFALHNEVPKRAREAFFLETFKTKPEDVTPLAKQIAKLQAKQILTTNYDRLLEYAVGSSVTTVGNTDQELASVNSLWNSTRYLVHIHGRSAVYDTLVYNEATYERVSRQGTYRELLKLSFMQNQVVALGFGWTDPPFIAALRFIVDQMSSASHFQHFAVLPQQSNADRSLLRAANINVLEYDSTNGHTAVERFVADLSRFKPGYTPQTIHIGELTESLVCIYSSLCDPGKERAYASATGALVAEQLSSGPLTEPEVISRVARRAVMSADEASALVSAGMTYLRSKDMIGVKDGRIVMTQSQTVDRTSSVTTSVLGRLRDSNKDQYAHFVRSVVTHVMMAEGKAAARAFVNQDQPEMYVLDRLVREAIAEVECPKHIREDLRRACVSVLSEPTKKDSEALYWLAHAAYVLERVFLNPTERVLGDALGWRLYLDSNVVMRALPPGAGSHPGLKSILERCVRLGMPIVVLGPFVLEMVEHAQRLGQKLQKARITSEKALTSYLRATPHRERSPFLEWYVSGRKTQAWKSYEQFLLTTRLASADGVSELIERMGVSIEGEDAIRTMDSSERETLWSELKDWRNADQDSQGVRRLRRAEATQVVWLARMRTQGKRAWFLSQDGQLRRALKYVADGRYSGYVMTPTAWAFRLQEQHWGDVDVRGFAELVWAVPQQTTMEELQRLAMVRIVEIAPELVKGNPDHVRDLIEDRFSRHNAVVEAAARVDDTEYSPAADLSEQLLEPTVDEIIEQLRQAPGKR